MKIALYVPAWPPGSRPNGIVTYASHLVPSLRALGHEVFILTPDNMSKERDPYTIDLRQYDLPRSLWQSGLSRLFPNAISFKAGSSAIVSAIRHLVDRHGIEVFEIEESFGFSYAVSRLHVVPVVVRVHGPWFLNGRFDTSSVFSKSDSTREKREKRGILAADIVTSPSRLTLETVKFHYGIDLPTSLAIPNPICAVPEAARWKAHEYERNNLLFVGRFDRRKGGELVILAFGELAKKNKQLKLTFVGPDIGVKDARGAIECFDDYTRRVLSQDAKSRITFADRLPHAALADLRIKHFATICASQSEIFPYSVLEPMSFGCPLVTTSVGGIPEIIQSGRNGILIPPQDVAAMVSALQTLLDNPPLAASLGAQAWKDCRSRFHSDEIARSTADAYEQAIDHFNRDAPRRASSSRL